jgi:hypothetical protein
MGQAQNTKLPCDSIGGNFAKQSAMVALGVLCLCSTRFLSLSINTLRCMAV